MGSHPFSIAALIPLACHVIACTDRRRPPNAPSPLALAPLAAPHSSGSPPVVPFRPKPISGGLTLSCRGAERADVTLELTGVALRRSSDPARAAAGRWNQFEGDYRLEAGAVRRAGRIAGQREQDYVFLGGESLSTERGAVIELTIAQPTCVVGCAVQWHLGPDGPPTGRESASLTCTGTLLTAPAPSS